MLLKCTACHPFILLYEKRKQLDVFAVYYTHPNDVLRIPALKMANIHYYNLHSSKVQQQNMRLGEVKKSMTQ